MPENNYEAMIRGFVASNSDKDFVLITNVEENKFIEEELKKAMDTALDLHIESTEAEYSVDLENYLEDDYVDAFENIVYLDDIGLDEEESLEDSTIELYPGLRKVSLKNKK